MKKRDLIIIAAILAAAAALFAASYLVTHLGGGNTVEIYVDNRLYQALPLDEDRTVEISQADGWVNHVEIKGGAVRMLSSNCANQDCVRMGTISPENEGIYFGTIVCLPHKITVELRLGGEG